MKETNLVGPNAGLPVDFVIITALEEEREAVLAKLPDYKKLPRDGLDVHTYYEARVVTNRPDHTQYRVIVTSLSGMGPIKGASKATSIIQRWNPRHVLLVGIAGGVKGEVAPGDVVVASQIVDYSLGKSTEGGHREVRWVAHQAEANLFDAASNFRRGWEDLIATERPRPGAPQRIMGVVASGGDVVADPGTIAKYIEAWPKLVGIEMEAAGVAAALFESIEKPSFLMIRSVSDLANGQRNATTKKRWRAYACDVAAAYAVGLLRDGPTPASTPALSSVKVDAEVAKPVGPAVSTLLSIVYDSEPGDWHYHDGEGLFVYSKNADITISQREIDYEHDDFHEKWVNSFPDSSAYRATYEIKYRGTLIETKTFVLVDGSRVYLPLPKSRAKLKISRQEYRLGTIVNRSHPRSQEYDQYLSIAGIKIE